MTRIKVQMCRCTQCKSHPRIRKFQVKSFAKQFRRKGKQLLKNGIEELPTIRIMRYTD